MSFPLLHHAQEGDLGETAGIWLRSRGIPLPMSRQAYAFDRYKRLWLSTHPRDALAGLRVSSVKGLVSVVLPVYNGEKYLQEALDGLQQQTYRLWELIAVDDGSSDRSGEILDRFASQEQRAAVIHQENRTLPVALSRGFRIARGQYLTWTSCDNRFHPNFLERMVAALEEHPSWDMVFANQDLIGEDGSPLLNSAWFRTYQRPRGSEHIHLPRDVSELNTRANNTVGAGVLYRDRAAYLLGDYSRFQYTVEDYDYWMKVNELLNLRHILDDRPLADYRFHTGSLTAREDELAIRRRRDRLMIFDDFRRNFSLTPLGWQIIPGAGGEPASSLAARLSEAVRLRGQILLEKEENPEPYLGQLWMPLVSVYVTDEPGWNKTPEAAGACGKLKVLVAAGGRGLPAELEDGWDLCIGVGVDENLPRLDGNYRGWFGVASTDTEALFAAIDIRARSEAVHRIEAEAFQPPKSELKASAIICTYRRSDQLAKAVAALARQSFPAGDFEVIVVDNQPGDPAVGQQIELLREQYFASCPERLKKVACPVTGLSFARNAGVSAARGEVLCFIDDDAIPNDDWLERVWEAFSSHPEAGVVGGAIRLQVPEPRPPVLKEGWEKYWSQFLPVDAEISEIEDYAAFPWGANWSARRRALVEIGGFRSGYGRKAASYASHEEIVAACLIRRLGYTVVVAPKAEVLHAVSPERFTYRHVRRIIDAGIIGNHHGKNDLYFPCIPPQAKSRERHSNPGVGHFTSSRKSSSPTWKSPRLLGYHALARLHLAGARLADLWKRLRKPISLV
ncbi:MAG: glycosyltransferase [Chloroflexi bacterium]|nr:glycosyltransferase [Chloroflexota bacterium]